MAIINEFEIENFWKNIFVAHLNSRQRVFLIYVFPIFHNTVIDSGQFQLVDSIYSPMTMKYTNIYNLSTKGD